MNLGVFLAIGESFEDLSKKGQAARLTEWNLEAYAKKFDKVYVFSYSNENYRLPKKCFLIKNSTNLHRYFYSLALPIIHGDIIKSCHVLRGLQITGGIPGAIAKVIFNKRLVVNFGYDYFRVAWVEGKFFQSLLYIISVPIINFIADKIIITAPYLRKYVPRQKSILIPNGVDTNLFKPRKKQPKSILFVGRLEKQKNIDLLIKAINLIKHLKPSLRIVGEGAEKSHLKFLAKKLGLKASFLGAVSYNMLPKLYGRSAIFILPSSVEGSPKSLIEAMAASCAVIGTNVQGINNVIKDGVNGLLVKSDKHSLAKAISRLMNSDNLRNKLALNARLFAEKNYNLETLLQKEATLLANQISK